MIKLTSKLLMAALALSVTTTTLSANAVKGQKLYLKKLKGKCGFNGTKFSGLFIREDLEIAQEDGEIQELFIKVCPKAKSVISSDKFKEKYMEHIYDFAYEYAADSGNVPSC
ncbi:MAG: cytochrome C [Campylobacterota bacterium]|nr:cytochrome C [Campylobacterota bacterium]